MSFNPASQTFVLNQKLMSIGGDLWIDDAEGNHAFEVDGKALALRRTLVLLDQAGSPLYEINQSLAHLHHTFEIKSAARPWLRRSRGRSSASSGTISQSTWPMANSFR